MPAPRTRVVRRLRDGIASIGWTQAVALLIVLVLFATALAVSIEAAHMAAGGE